MGLMETAAQPTDWWAVAIGAYLIAAFVTLLPALWAWLKGVELHPGGVSFDTTNAFSQRARSRLVEHFSRMEGTLGFWKKRASMYTRFHYYCVFWTILSAWAVPLVSAMAPLSDGSSTKWFVVVVSSHVALALSLHRGLKASEGMKAFRHGESEFYDCYRRLMDRPELFGATEDEQLDSYFADVETIRRFVRHAETETVPDIEGLRSSPDAKGS